MLQWFISFPEFTEILFYLGKTPLNEWALEYFGHTQEHVKRKASRVTESLCDYVNE